MKTYPRESGIVRLVTGVMLPQELVFNICLELVVNQGPWPWSLTMTHPVCVVHVVVVQFQLESFFIPPVTIYLGYWHNETSTPWEEVITLWGMEVRVQKSCTCSQSQSHGSPDRIWCKYATPCTFYYVWLIVQIHPWDSWYWMSRVSISSPYTRHWESHRFTTEYSQNWRWFDQLMDGSINPGLELLS
jgi:hypothetical protein